MVQGIDYKKRARVMQRSKTLGHCICDARRRCPCDIFIAQDLCPCAGERPVQQETSTLKLTQLSSNAGCASKISASDLEGLLARLPVVNDPAVISGLAAADDAGVYRINAQTTLVQTVDVFTPCVDDPYIFGKICAANCLSDIYAMGAVPRTALSILAFPSETQEKEIMYLMLKGAMEVLGQANCALLGGHSIKDTEVKLGFAITGTIDAGKAVSLETAQVSDVLVLTKPLGVGVLIFANQIGRSHLAGMAAAEHSMMALNKEAAEVMVGVGVSACTDITGFGLFGHLLRMMRHSKTSARLEAGLLPVFGGVLDLLREGVISGAIERNADFAGDDLIVGEEVSEEFKYLGFSPETSGGLLMAVPQGRQAALLDGLKARGVSGAIIGQVIAGGHSVIELVATNDGDKMDIHKKENVQEKSVCCEPGCSSVTAAGGITTAGDSLKAFMALVSTVTASGKIDQRTKELILFGLVLQQRCHGCFDLHYEKALGMGITKEELEEVMWCAALIGGASTKMFYGECLKQRAGKK